MAGVDVSCLCGRARTTLWLMSPVPVESSLCHRSQCRYNLGALCHSALPIKVAPESHILDGLTVFEPQQGLRRYFCSICGSHLFQNDVCWRVQSGVVERIHNEQVFGKLERIVDHTAIHETLDGGLSVSLTGSQLGTKALDLHSAGSGLRMQDQQCPALATSILHHEEDPSRLRAECFCGGVAFFLTRPNATSSSCSSPWPDLIVPYHSHSSENAEDVKWWIRSPHKWLAGTCACRSCRIGLGSPFQAWAFVSLSNLFKPDGISLDFDLDMLQSFESSPGATREFCRCCGATVFWHNNERPGVVDVSIGLLRAKEGALASSWLQWWTERVSFAEDAFDKDLISILQVNLPQLEHSAL